MNTFMKSGWLREISPGLGLGWSMVEGRSLCTQWHFEVRGSLPAESLGGQQHKQEGH